MSKLTSVQKFFLVTFLVFLPTQLSYHLWPDFSLVNGIRVDYLSPTIYLTDIVLFFLFASSIKTFTHLKKSKNFFFFLFFLSLNVLLSKSLLVSLIKAFKFIEIFLLSYFVYKNKNEIKKLLDIPLTILANSMCLFSFLQWLKGGSIGGMMYLLGERNFTVNTPGIALSKIGDVVHLRPYSTLPHPNALAGLLLVTVLLIEDKKTKTYWITAILVLITILLTQSYAVWLSLCVVILFALLSNKVKFSNVFRRSFLTVGFMLSLLSPVFFNLLHFQILNKNIFERIQLIVVSGKIISNNFLFGTGLNTFIINIPKHLKTSIPFLQPVHNVPLLIFTEGGIVGSLFVFYVLQNVQITLPILVVFVTSLFDHYWITLQSTSLLLALVIGLSWKNGSLKKKPSELQ